MSLYKKQKISLLILIGLLVIIGGTVVVLRLTNFNMSAFRQRSDTILNQANATYKNSQNEQISIVSNWISVKLALPTPTPLPID